MTAMLNRILAMIVLAAFSGAASAKDFCSYPDTNGLVWDKKFESAIKGFFGSEKLEYFYRRSTTANQVMAGLGGVPDVLVRLDAKHVIASACRHQSCVEKAAVVLACPDKLVAVGIFHSDCLSKAPSENCASERHLTVYSRDDNALARVAIESWGRTAADSYGYGLVTHQKVKHRGKWVDPGSSSPP